MRRGAWLFGPEFPEREYLFDPAIIVDHQGLGKGLDILLIVRDQYHRDIEAVLQIQQFQAQAGAQQRIQGGERFVQQQVGLVGQGGGQRYPLWCPDRR